MLNHKIENETGGGAERLIFSIREMQSQVFQSNNEKPRWTVDCHTMHCAAAPALSPAVHTTPFPRKPKRFGWRNGKSLCVTTSNRILSLLWLNHHKFCSFLCSNLIFPRILRHSDPLRLRSWALSHLHLHLSSHSLQFSICKFNSILLKSVHVSIYSMSPSSPPSLC